MDFQTYQDQARQSTAKMVALLALGVVAIVVVVSAVVTVLLASGSTEIQPLSVVAVVAPATTIAVAGTSLVKSSQIRRGGGSYLATSMGGRQIDATTPDPAERRLVNVVEEVAIASGSPVPALFVLDDEPSINAFAAGWTEDRTAIGVTKGALVHLDRHELQGVIAHEFSHITNGDTRIKTRIIGWVFGIAALTVLGRILLSTLWFGPRRRGRDDRSGLMLIVVGLVLLIVGAVGAFFARLVQAAVSRQREYLADASAVQYTREPSGLGHALMKIGGFEGDHTIRSAHATEASHLFFAPANGSAFATHPPLRDRISRLIPDWTGQFVATQATNPGSRQRSVQTSPVERGGRRGRPPQPPIPWLGPPPGQRPPPPRSRHRGLR